MPFYVDRKGVSKKRILFVNTLRQSKEIFLTLKMKVLKFFETLVSI
jgi:hypothetical protein